MGLKFRNAVICHDDFTLRTGSFQAGKGVFTSFEEAADSIDLQGAYVIPGLIDIHIHGCAGGDFSTTSLSGLMKIAEYLGRNGITSFVPTSMTLPEETLKTAFETAVKYHELKLSGTARLLGIHMEGPFLSPEKNGAQAPEHLRLPDLEMVERLYEASKGLLKIVCIAPELPGAMDFIRRFKDQCRVSVGHTNADYTSATKAFKAGALQVTHLYNGMLPFLHRAPGVVGAAADSEQVSVELICDGYHVHESVIRAAFSMFSDDRIILVSDSLSCLGMPEGVYESGGMKVCRKNGFAVLDDGVTFAGSDTNLFQCMRKAISFGIRPEHAIKAATINPAKAVGADDRVGSISLGKAADFVVCDRDFNIRQCYIGGNRVL